MIQDCFELSSELHPMKRKEKNIPVKMNEIRIMIIFMILTNENKINFFSLHDWHAVL
jgi:hypothetical protein